MNRRHFSSRLLQGTAGVLTLAPLARAALAAPAIIENRPVVTHGVQSGDVGFDSAVIWSRANRRSRLLVEWTAREAIRDNHRVRGPWTGSDRDFTAKLELDGLPPGQRIYYQVQFEDEAGHRSEPVAGHAGYAIGW